AKTWARNEIYFNHRAGFGLDPRAADIDGDGDLDLVAADRSSLVLLENVGSSALSSRPGSILSSDKYNHEQPLSVLDGQPVREAKSPADYGLRRYHIQRAMQDFVMGALPDPSRRVPLDVKIEKREETPDYVRIKLTYVP